ncbi:ensconsin isoform X5 [Balamuthia mandrillaris]
MEKKGLLAEKKKKKKKAVVVEEASDEDDAEGWERKDGHLPRDENFFVLDIATGKKAKRVKSFSKISRAMLSTNNNNNKEESSSAASSPSKHHGKQRSNSMRETKSQVRPKLNVEDLKAPPQPPQQQQPKKKKAKKAKDNKEEEEGEKEEKKKRNKKQKKPKQKRNGKEKSPRISFAAADVISIDSGKKGEGKRSAREEEKGEVSYEALMSMIEEENDKAATKQTTSASSGSSSASSSSSKTKSVSLVEPVVTKGEEEEEKEEEREEEEEETVVDKLKEEEKAERSQQQVYALSKSESEELLEALLIADGELEEAEREDRKEAAEVKNDLDEVLRMLEEEQEADEEKESKREEKEEQREETKVEALEELDELNKVLQELAVYGSQDDLTLQLKELEAEEGKKEEEEVKQEAEEEKLAAIAKRQKEEEEEKICKEIEEEERQKKEQEDKELKEREAEEERKRKEDATRKQKEEEERVKAEEAEKKRKQEEEERTRKEAEARKRKEEEEEKQRKEKEEEERRKAEEAAAREIAEKEAETLRLQKAEQEEAERRKRDEENDRQRKEAEQKEKEEDNAQLQLNLPQQQEETSAAVEGTPRGTSSRKDRVYSEFLATEEAYCRSLDIVVSLYLEPLRAKGLLDKQDLNTVFSNISILHQIHSKLLQDIRRASDSLSFATSLMAFVPFMKMYTTYINSYDKADKRLKELVKGSKKLEAFLEECKQKPECRSLDLASYLIMVFFGKPFTHVFLTFHSNSASSSEQPIQRLPRYQLLLKELMEHTTNQQEHKKLEALYDAVIQLNRHVNQHKGEQMKTQKLLKLRDILLKHKLDIFDRADRQLLNEGRFSILETDDGVGGARSSLVGTHGVGKKVSKQLSVKIHTASGSTGKSMMPSFQEDYFFLFDDVLVEVKQQFDSKGGEAKYKYIRHFQLSSCKAESVQARDPSSILLMDLKTGRDQSLQAFVLWHFLSSDSSSSLEENNYRRYYLKYQHKQERDEWFTLMEKRCTASIAVQSPTLPSPRREASSAPSSSSSSSASSPSIIRKKEEENVAQAANEANEQKQQSLSGLEKKDRIRLEFLETEEAYFKSLEVILNHYMEPLQKKGFLDRHDMSTIFSNISTIHGIHKKLLLDIKQSSDAISFSNSLLAFFPFLKMYTTYINSYDKADKRLKELVKGSKKMENFLEECKKKPECRSLDLSSYLIMPIQRLPRYELLLRDIIRATSPQEESELQKLNAALATVVEVNKHVNQKKGEEELSNRLLILRNALLKYKVDIFDRPTRQLLKEGQLSVLELGEVDSADAKKMKRVPSSRIGTVSRAFGKNLSPSFKDHYVFLFDDLWIELKAPILKASDKVKYVQHFSLANVKAEDVSPSDPSSLFLLESSSSVTINAQQDHLAFVLFATSTSTEETSSTATMKYFVRAGSKKDKEDWQRLVQEQVAELQQTNLPPSSLSSPSVTFSASVSYAPSPSFVASSTISSSATTQSSTSSIVSASASPSPSPSPSPAAAAAWVASSPSSQRLSAKDRIRKEFIETEQSYVRSLHLVNTLYLLPLQQQSIMSEEDANTIFSNIATLLDIHQKILADLTKPSDTKEDQRGSLALEEILLQYLPFLKMYTVYVNNFDKANERLQELMGSSKKFSNYLESCKTKPESQGLDLFAYLIMPVQRLPRYELLLRDLAKNTPEPEQKGQIEKVLQKVKELNDHLNQSKGQEITRQKLYRLQMAVKHKVDIFSRPDRNLLKEGFLQIQTTSSDDPLSADMAEEEDQKSSSRHLSVTKAFRKSFLISSSSSSTNDHYFFLFDDLWIEVKLQQQSKNSASEQDKFKYVHHSSLSSMFVEELSSSSSSAQVKEDVSFVIYFYNDEEEAVAETEEAARARTLSFKSLLHATNQKEKEEWIDLLRERTMKEKPAVESPSAATPTTTPTLIVQQEEEKERRPKRGLVDMASVIRSSSTDLLLNATTTTKPAEDKDEEEQGTAVSTSDLPEKTESIEELEDLLAQLTSGSTPSLSSAAKHSAPSSDSHSSSSVSSLSYSSSHSSFRQEQLQREEEQRRRKAEEEAQRAKEIQVEKERVESAAWDFYMKQQEEEERRTKAEEEAQQKRIAALQRAEEIRRRVEQENQRLRQQPQAQVPSSSSTIYATQSTSSSLPSLSPYSSSSSLPSFSTSSYSSSSSHPSLSSPSSSYSSFPSLSPSPSSSSSFSPSPPLPPQQGAEERRVCASCHRTIEELSATRCEGKLYHNHCFVCRRCGVNLGVTSRFMILPGGLGNVCPPCYNLHLQQQQQKQPQSQPQYSSPSPSSSSFGQPPPPPQQFYPRRGF